MVENDLMVAKSKPQKCFLVETCFKKLIYQMNFLLNSSSKILYKKHCHNQMFQQQNELEN